MTQAVLKSGYQFLTEEEKDKVRSVVYLVDLFCVSDAAYHELSMIDQENLPRSYLMKHTVFQEPKGNGQVHSLALKMNFIHQLSKQVKMYYNLCKKPPLN